MAHHEINAVSPETAKRFWEQQENARIFLHPDVLGPLCERVDWWMATWKGSPVCLWPVCHSFDGSQRSPELSSYVGPLWHDNVGQIKAHRWWTLTKTVQNAFLELFIGSYGSFEFELPPGSNDVRVFQWARDNMVDSLSIQIEPRHTAILGPLDEGFPEGALAGFSGNKRRSVVTTRKDAPVAWLNPSDDQLYDLYERLLNAKSSIHVAQRRKEELMSLLRVARAGFGNILSYCDLSGNPVGFSLTLFSRKTASLVAIAVSDRVRAGGIPAWLTMEGIIANCLHGADSLDFLGANSVVGAEEKHRYGAWPEMYFRISVIAR